MSALEKSIRWVKDAQVVVALPKSIHFVSPDHVLIGAYQ
jgi:hypothetical protein